LRNLLAQVEEVPPVLRRRINELLDRDWQLAIALALAVGVLVWFGRSINDFFSPAAAGVMVPAMIGQTENDAINESNTLKLKGVVIDRQPSDQFPKDVVMGQIPAAGAHVREGRQVSLIVSRGVNIFAMPDLRNETLRQVKLDLARLHLSLADTKVVPNDDLPANSVVSQDPPPLTSVREGSQVSLQLSKGPPLTIRVPSFVDLQLDDARALAAATKTHLGQIVWTPFGAQGPPRGTVIRQLPGANQLIDPFDPVSLQVSAGPQEYGRLVREVHATVTVPQQDGSAGVRVEVRDETGTWVAYDGFAQGGQKLDLTVTAVGTAELDTYINNELLNQTKLGVEPPHTEPASEALGRPHESRR
jgi:eukaryotic-like serine/threonine-protein kinase